MAKFVTLTHIYPPALDGGSQILFHLSKFLKKHHHEVLVITSNAASTDDFVNSHNKSVTHQPSIISLSVDRYFHYFVRLVLKFLKPICSVPLVNTIYRLFLILRTGPIFSLFPAIWATWLIIKYRPGYILTGPLPTTILIYARFFKLACVILGRTSPQIIVVPCFHHQDPSFLNPQLASLLSKSDYIATLTDFENNYLASYLTPSPANIFTLGAGVNTSLIIQSAVSFPKTPHLLFLGNFAAHKGIVTLLDAFSLVTSKHDSTRLTIAGQPTLYYPTILKHLSSIPASTRSQIRLLPRRFNTKRLITLLDSATCLVLPSIHESFGIVIVEAWARGKPVIVADIPAPVGLVTASGGGLIFKSLDPKSLSLVMLEIISNPKLARTLGHRGLSFTQKHLTWDKIGQCLLLKLHLLA